MNFLHSLQSEMLKTKRTAAVWLSFIGGFFIPLIDTIYCLNKGVCINSLSESGMNAWTVHFMSSMDKMASFLLPAGIILASSLLTQMEYKNNTWKQLHTTPQSYSMVFMSKFTAILILTLQFFLFFNLGVFLSGVIPCLVSNGSFPDASIPWLFLIKANIKAFISCLPILALQYLLSFRFKNFVVPIGIGLVMLIGSLIALSWKHVYWSPYIHTMLHMSPERPNPSGLGSHWWSLIQFAFIMGISYIIYLKRKEKG
jgi:hypothetical protein